MSEAAARPTPPAWPERGTPEYEARIAKMRQGHAARVQKAAQKPPQPRTAPPVAEPDLIDVGDPNPARMAPEPREKAKGKPAARGKGEFEQSQVHKNIKLGLDILARMPGHEHWHREDDEVEMLAEPATRCLNRLDKKLIERMRTVSDPAALVFACVMILGPSIGEEIKHVGAFAKGPQRRTGRSQGIEQQQQPTREPEPWVGGHGYPDTSHLSTNGAHPTAPIEGIPPTF